MTVFLLKNLSQFAILYSSSYPTEQHTPAFDISTGTNAHIHQLLLSQKPQLPLTFQFTNLFYHLKSLG
jgi:hypothetical protein